MIVVLMSGSLLLCRETNEKVVDTISAGTYDVVVGDKALHALNSLLEERFSGAKKFILVDENTQQHCLTELISEVDALHSSEFIEIESGENNKNIEICVQLWEAFTELEARRSSVLINLGGGVITDMGGFLAATFKRGMHFINVPTTLLAQVDASIGGKTGIDLQGLKNQVGAFADPAGVFVYPKFLASLSSRDLRAGFAEVIKHALVSDANEWKQVKAADLSAPKELAAVVARSIAIKNSIVQRDPKERGERKKLNFGHTIGHALETQALELGKSLLHGEAVAVGIVCEAHLSHQSGQLSEADLNEIVGLIQENYALYEIDETMLERFFELMLHDKKNRGKELNFTLLNGIGDAAVDNTCEKEDVLTALEYYRNSF